MGLAIIFTDPPYNEFIVGEVGDPLPGSLVTDPQKTWNLFQNILLILYLTMHFGALGWNDDRFSTL